MKKIILSITSLALLLIVVLGYQTYLRPQAAHRYFDDPKVVSLANAARTGNTQKIDTLIAEGVDVNALGKEELNPLYWLFLMNDDSEKKKTGFKHLLLNNADPLQIDTKREYTVLHIAASYDDIYYLQTIIETQPDTNLDFEIKKSQETPLLQALFSDRNENFKLLINSGANIEHKNRFDETPLIETTNVSNWEMTLFLLENGANFLADSTDKDTIPNLIETINKSPYTLAPDQYDSRQPVIDFLKAKGVELDPWTPEKLPQ